MKSALARARAVQVFTASEGLHISGFQLNFNGNTDVQSSHQTAHQTPSQAGRDRLLRLPEVEAATGLKKSTVYLLMARGTFPRCVQLTARCVAWPESHVQQWVQGRIAAAQEVTQ